VCFGVGNTLSVGVAMAKGSSKSATNFSELLLACLDSCLLVGLERTFLSSKNRSTDGDRVSLKSMKVLRTDGFDDNIGTPITSLQLGGACTSLGALVLDGASNPRAATGAPPPVKAPSVQVPAALLGAACSKLAVLAPDQGMGCVGGNCCDAPQPGSGGHWPSKLTPPALPKASLLGEVLKIRGPPAAGPATPPPPQPGAGAPHAPPVLRPPGGIPVSGCCIACNSAAPAFLYEFKACCPPMATDPGTLQLSCEP